VVDPKAFGQQSILCLNHVTIAVAWEPGVLPVAWFARLAVADAVREDDEELRRIKRLARTKELAGKFVSNELGAAAGRAVDDEDGVLRRARRVLAALPRVR
jgi:hypothetical protein